MLREKLPYDVAKINLKYVKYWNVSWSAARSLKFYKNPLFKKFWKNFCMPRLWNKKFQIGVIINQWKKKKNDESYKRDTDLSVIQNLLILCCSFLKVFPNILSRGPELSDILLFQPYSLKLLEFCFGNGEILVAAFNSL